MTHPFPSDSAPAARAMQALPAPAALTRRPLRAAAFAGAAFVLALGLGFARPAHAEHVAKPLTWKVDGKSYSGYLVYDEAGRDKRPGLLMVPNWMGVNDSAIEKAKRLAGDDFVVLLTDVYGTGKRPKDATEAGKFAKALRDNRVELRKRIDGAVGVLKAQAGKSPLDPTKLGAVGFCFGGSTVLELVRGGNSEIAGVVSLHGGIATSLPAAAGAAKAPVLVLNGADDKGVTPKDIAEFEAEMNHAGADWQFVNFSGAVHCFAEEDANSPPGCQYNERAARRAFRMMDDFFAERFASKE